MATVWDKALIKRQNRRAAGEECTHVPATVTRLDEAMKKTLGKKANDTQNTYVVGYLKSKGSYLAVGIPEDYRYALAQNLNVQLDAIRFLTRETNLHAEMAIVRYVCTEIGIDKGSLAGALYIACTGKGCCADCCGWMTKYSIGHGPKCDATGSSQGWMHPLTGATFRGEKDQDFTYSKPSKYRTAATTYQKNPPGA